MAKEKTEDKLISVLRDLDPADDNQWTPDGEPRLDLVKERTGNNFLTREVIAKAAPDFNRENLRKVKQGETITTKPTVETPKADPAVDYDKQREELEKKFQAAKKVQDEKRVALDKARIEFEAAQKETD